MYIYIYIFIYIYIYIYIYMLYNVYYIYKHLVTLDTCFIMHFLKIEFTYRKYFVSLLVYYEFECLLILF